MRRGETQEVGAKARGCFLSRLNRTAAATLESDAADRNPSVGPRPTPEWIEPQQAVEPIDVFMEQEERPRVVAEILSDGAVQVLDRAAEGQAQGPWGSGHLNGKGWTIWWERRRWA